MEQGRVQIYSGSGSGKSSAAIGKAVQEASLGKKVVMITFLKGEEANDLFKRLEPEIMVFRFEKSEDDFEKLSQERQQEEIKNIKNGINFAKKVLSTDECDLLILDEILGLVDNQIISVEDVRNLIESRPEDMDVIMTGRTLDDQLKDLADEISMIKKV